MAANYTGSPTAVQSPATAPAVNNPIVISIPAGSDVRTIESITQAMKVLADNGTFLLQIAGGTRTVPALVVDGAGGAAVSPGASHVVITGNVPGLVTSVGAGTSPTASVHGNDTHGNISLTTGTSPTGGAGIAILSLILNSGFSASTNGFTVRLSPTNPAAAALSGAQAVYASQLSSTQMVISCAGATPLAAATAYSWSYLIIGM